MFYFSSADIELAGASPETLVQLRDGVLHTFPLARNLSSDVPILGVCLGHQAICEAYRARIVHACKRRASTG